MHMLKLLIIDIIDKCHIFAAKEHPIDLWLDLSNQNVLPLPDITAVSNRTIDAFQALLTLRCTIAGFRPFLKCGKEGRNHPFSVLSFRRFPFDYLRHAQPLSAQQSTLGLPFGPSCRSLNPYFQSDSGQISVSQ